MKTETFNQTDKKQGELDGKNAETGISVMKQLKMEVNQSELQIQIRIEGLWGKYYKVHIDGQHLTVSALRWYPRVGENSDELTGEINQVSSSFYLPCKVQKDKLWSEIETGLLTIRIPVAAQGVNQFSGFEETGSTDFLSIN